MAINYGLLEDLEQAQSCLRKYLQNSPEGDMFIEAQELLWALDDDEVEIIDDRDDMYFIKDKEQLVEDIQNLSKDEFIKNGNDALHGTSWRRCCTRAMMC